MPVARCLRVFGITVDPQGITSQFYRKNPVHYSVDTVTRHSFFVPTPGMSLFGYAKVIWRGQPRRCTVHRVTPPHTAAATTRVHCDTDSICFLYDLQGSVLTRAAPVRTHDLGAKINPLLHTHFHESLPGSAHHPCLLGSSGEVVDRFVCPTPLPNEYASLSTRERFQPTSVHEWCKI